MPRFPSEPFHQKANVLPTHSATPWFPERTAPPPSPSPASSDISVNRAGAVSRMFFSQPNEPTRYTRSSVGIVVVGQPPPVDRFLLSLPVLTTCHVNRSGGMQWDMRIVRLGVPQQADKRADRATGVRGRTVSGKSLTR
ncbi:hypothetical protein K0M31_002702 [Melipona bicolor]|uniref:Uncharacterized protein n=1 Tax=Melipona bicolor TaxID=60889 RepID=A0AA40FZG9_9HYME|nr:hypothetical protein K0M31_002702 [Melipona bicolor]